MLPVFVSESVVEVGRTGGRMPVPVLVVIGGEVVVWVDPTLEELIAVVALLAAVTVEVEDSTPAELLVRHIAWLTKLVPCRGSREGDK